MSEEFAAGYDKGYTEGFAQAALEAERLRAALKQARDDVWRIVDSALAGTEAKNG